MKPFLILLMFIIGLTAVTSLSAEEQKIDIVLVKQPIRGKIGEVVKIHFEAVNNTSETFVIKNIIRVNDGMQMNGVLIRDGNRVHSSNLKANWDTTKKNPMEDVLPQTEGEAAALCTLDNQGRYDPEIGVR